MKLKLFLVLFFLVSVKIFAQTKNLAPNIKAVDVHGKQFELYSSTKPKIIQFMRVYCGGRMTTQSAEQFKQLVRYYEKYKDKILFVTVTLSSCQSSDLKEIAKYFGVKWTFINDFSDYKLDIIQAYSTYLKDLKDPALIFVNKKNEIVSKTDFCDDEKLKEYINLIIEKTSSTKKKKSNKFSERRKQQ